MDKILLYKPETVFTRMTVTEFLHMMYADQFVGSTRTGHSREEAGGLTMIALSLVIWEQLKGFPFCLHCTLEEGIVKSI